jgi:hypothetical protein
MDAYAAMTQPAWVRAQVPIWVGQTGRNILEPARLQVLENLVYLQILKS